MENYVKVLIEKGPAFTYLRGNVLHKFFYENVKADVFIGPQIRQLFNDQQFVAALRH